MPLPRRPLTLLLYLIALTSLASAGCFWPDGTDRNAAYNATKNYTLTTDYYLPCNSVEGEVSMCCASWDQCQANGMCYNSGYEVYWRESCSIKNWNDSPNCIKLFVNESIDIVVTPCPGSSSFCLGSAAYDCCNAGEGVFIVNGEQTTQNPNSTSSTTSSRTTSTPSAAATTLSSGTPIPNPSPSSGLSTGAKAGIGVAVALGALLLGVLAFFLLRRRRQRRSIESDPHRRRQLAPAEKPAFDTDSPVERKRPFAAHEVDSEHHVPRIEMPIGTEAERERDGRDGEAAELGG